MFLHICAALYLPYYSTLVGSDASPPNNLSSVFPSKKKMMGNQKPNHNPQKYSLYSFLRFTLSVLLSQQPTKGTKQRTNNFVCVFANKEYTQITMTIAATTNLSELAAFRADDTVVEIIPQFTLPQPLRLHTMTSSSSSHHHPKGAVGPWQAGIPTPVPLWLACHLQTKRLGTVVLPQWLSVSNLVEILDHERQKETLWPTTDDDEHTRLPFEYYQIAQRMSSILPPAVQLLLKDLLQVRLDKLRQQFQGLIRNNPPDNNSSSSTEEDEEAGPPDHTTVNISGMGSMEIALLQKTVQQALKDRDVLRQAGRRIKTTNWSTAYTETQPQQEEEKESSSSSVVPPRVPPPPPGGDSQDTSTTGSDDRRAPPRRVNLRKFRS
jgi:hypothetical protein